MLVIEIAVGVALGLLLFRYLPQIIGAALAVGTAAVGSLLVIALIGGLVALVWFNLKLVATVLATLACVAVAYGVPFALKDRIERRYPQLREIVAGQAPYDRISKLPLRLAVMTPLAVGVAGAGIAALLAGVYAVDLLSRVIDGP